jgi:hypothetical protein
MRGKREEESDAIDVCVLVSKVHVFVFARPPGACVIKARYCDELKQ